MNKLSNSLLILTLSVVLAACQTTGDQTKVVVKEMVLVGLLNWSNNKNPSEFVVTEDGERFSSTYCPVLSGCSESRVRTRLHCERLYSPL